MLNDQAFHFFDFPLMPSRAVNIPEEGVEGIITTTDGLVGGHLAIRLQGSEGDAGNGVSRISKKTKKNATRQRCSREQKHMALTVVYNHGGGQGRKDGKGNHQDT